MGNASAIRPRAAMIIALCLTAVPASNGCAGTTSARPVTESRDGRKRASRTGVYHRLEKGQTLSAISRVYQVPVATLIQVNGISDPNAIPAHTAIFVPA